MLNQKARSSDKVSMKNIVKILLFVFCLAWQGFTYAQIDKGGGGVTEEVLVVDKDHDYIIINGPDKFIEKGIFKGKLKRFSKKIDEFLTDASNELTTCRNRETKFKTIKEFHLYLSAAHAVHMVTTSSFLPSQEKCGEETGVSANDTCVLSTPTVQKLKKLMESKHFSNYLFAVEGLSLREAGETKKYFEELFR